MKEKKWVQHISGQGEKWEVVQEWSDGRNVRRVRDGLVYLFPIDEYVECSPPEVWVDATDEFKVSEGGGNLICKMDGTWLSSKNDGYRLRKVELYWAHPDSKQNCIQQAFIIERRQP